MKYLITVVMLFLILTTKSQEKNQPKYDVFKAETYIGTIRNSEITLQLYFNDDEIFGYYFYNKFGQLIPLSGKKDGLNFILTTENNDYCDLEPQIKDSIEGVIGIDSLNNYSTIKGVWIAESKKNKFEAERIKSRIQWRFFSHQYSFNLTSNQNKPQTEYISTVFPSIKSAPNLNRVILLSSLNGNCKNYIPIINLSKCNSLKIEEDFDDEYFKVGDLNNSPEDFYCWESSSVGRIIYYNDSLVSYTKKNLRNVINVHGWNETSYQVFKFSTGEEVYLKDIIDEENYKYVLDLLNKKSNISF